LDQVATVLQCLALGMAYTAEVPKPGVRGRKAAGVVGDWLGRENPDYAR
jgi:hypothetical protein